MIGQRLGSFHIDSKIGSGAMGEVFKASQKLKDGRTRIAAVKIVSADFLERDLALKRFQREAEILAQLRHPNIVRYYAHGKFQGTYYYAMEFVEGETLDAVLERQEYLPWQDVVDLGIQLCQALQYAHDHQVVHRDLKPSNLMIAAENRIKLTDFGIAKDLDAEVNLTRTGRTLGTAAYMAPEQIRGNPPISHKTDLYALGCLLYQMLTGKPPFEGKAAVVLMHAHMAEPPPRPSGKIPDVPRALDDLVVQLMSKEPSERPWDAAQVAHLLEELRGRAKRGDRIEMVFDRAREKVAATGGIVIPQTNGGTRATGSRAGTSNRMRKPAKGRTSRPSEEGQSSDRRRLIETSLLAMALVGLIGLIAYLVWPPSMETLYEKATPLIQSDSRVDWKRALTEYVEPIERRFDDHPYAEEFAELRDRIALDEAYGRALVLESPTPLGRPRPDRPVEILYKNLILEIEPGQHARIALSWQKFVDEVSRRNDPDEHGWLLLGQQKRNEALEALREQKRLALNLFQQALLNEKNELVESARAQLRQLIASYTNAAIGDPEFLQLIAQAEAVLKRLDSEPAMDPSSTAPPATDPPPSSPSDDASPAPESDEPDPDF